MCGLRYKWLRKRGYRTIGGREFYDYQFNDRSVLLTMKKGDCTKKTMLFDTDLNEVLEREQDES